MTQGVLVGKSGNAGPKVKYLIKEGHYVNGFKIGSLADGNIRISLGRYATVSSTSINTEDYTHLVIVGNNYGSSGTYGISIKFNGRNRLWCLRKGNNDYEQSNTTDVICGMDIPSNYSGTITFKGDELGGAVTVTDMFMVKL